MLGASDELTHAISTEATLSEEIDDVIDENPVEEISECIKDIDAAINKMESLRSKYRNVHKDLRTYFGENYDPQFGKLFGEKLLAMKFYIKSAIHVKNQIRKKESASKKEKIESKQKSTIFLVKDLMRVISDLDAEFRKTTKNIDDDELIRRKIELPHLTTKLEKISEKYKKALENPSTSAEYLQKV